MASDLTPDEIRETKFPVARRGYERAAVENFRQAVVAQVEALRRRTEELGARVEGGVPADVDSEIQRVTQDLGELLEHARNVADQMRSRASEDAARWRAEADAEARTARQGAQGDAEKLRADAWEAGTDLVTQSHEYAAQVVATAEQDALFIRAEAEREALRLTGDARRDAEEITREARNESERIVIAARVESEKILEDARRAAEAAQERARALEHRRSELMEELEAARQSIGQLEQEIDSRREGVTSTAPEPPEATADRDWLGDDASVRIVPATQLPIAEPVDADAMAAEVEQMRAGVVEAAPDMPLEPSMMEPAPAPEHDVAEPEHVAAEPDHDGAEPEAAVIEEEPSPPKEIAEEPEVAEVAAPAVVDDDGPPEPVQADESADSDAIDDLFAQLRSRPSDAAAPVESSDNGARGEVVIVDEPAGTEPAAEVEDSTTAAPVVSEESAAVQDPFDVRDRLLLPVTNRTLRGVKREIVELQNRVLEELRTAGSDWTPDPAVYGTALGREVSVLIQESFVAGHAGAAELVGSDTTPQPSGSAQSWTPAEFVKALDDAVTSTLAKARSSGGGVRQVSAAVSRIFRAWRTDEAERRLRVAARSAYHDGVLGGLDQLGVELVMAVAPGNPCGECPAGQSVAWAPGDDLPGGLRLPPATESCDATVVPAGRAG